MARMLSVMYDMRALTSEILMSEHKPALIIKHTRHQAVGLFSAAFPYCMLPS